MFHVPDRNAIARLADTDVFDITMVQYRTLQPVPPQEWARPRALPPGVRRNGNCQQERSSRRGTRKLSVENNACFLNVDCDAPLLFYRDDLAPETKCQKYHASRYLLNQ